MSEYESVLLSLRINRLGVQGVGHAWTNPDVRDSLSSVTIRNASGAECEICEYPELSDAELKRALAHFAKTGVLPWVIASQ